MTYQRFFNVPVSFPFFYKRKEEEKEIDTIGREDVTSFWDEGPT